MTLRQGQHAKLYLNNVVVGEVIVQRTEDSWAHGEFEPNPAFARFAETFGRWSLLIHADPHDEKLSNAAGDELREVERELDQLRAKLHFADSNEWVKCAQVNIDGPLIEWKLY